MNWRLAWAIARKDIVDAARNLYLMGAILTPLGFWLLFRVILPGEGGVTLGSIAIYDGGSSRLVAMLSSDPLVERVVLAGSEAELAEVVRGDAVGGIAIPAGFDAGVTSGASPELQVLVNGRRGGGELTAFRRLVDARLQEMANRPPVARVVQRDVQAGADPRSAAFASQGALLILFLVMGMAMAGTFVVPTLFVEEKEKNTLKTILVSPASYADVVAGKAVAGLLYTLLGAAVLLALYNNLSLNLPLLALAMLLGSLVLVEIGLLLGSVFNTTAQVNSWSSFVLLALIMPSWLSAFPLPGLLAAVMRLMPTYYIAQLVEQSGGGVGQIEAFISLGVLVAFAVALFAAIVWSLRRVAR
jgi:ABC-2 type transport system permease protein